MFATGSYCRARAVDVVRVEGRLNDLEQTLGRGALLGVDVPVVDGVGVTAGLADDVALDPVVGAGDAVLLHDGAGLADPAVEVVRCRPACGRRVGRGLGLRYACAPPRLVGDVLRVLLRGRRTGARQGWLFWRAASPARGTAPVSRRRPLVELLPTRPWCRPGGPFGRAIRGDGQDQGTTLAAAMPAVEYLWALAQAVELGTYGKASMGSDLFHSAVLRPARIRPGGARRRCVSGAERHRAFLKAPGFPGEKPPIY